MNASATVAASTWSFSTPATSWIRSLVVRAADTASRVPTISGVAISLVDDGGDVFSREEVLWIGEGHEVVLADSGICGKYVGGLYRAVVEGSNIKGPGLVEQPELQGNTVKPLQADQALFARGEIGVGADRDLAFDRPEVSDTFEVVLCRERCSHGDGISVLGGRRSQCLQRRRQGCRLGPPSQPRTTTPWTRGRGSREVLRCTPGTR